MNPAAIGLAMRCGTCDNKVAPEWVACPHCGTAVPRQPALAEPCPACFTTLVPGTMVCPHCGAMSSEGIEELATRGPSLGYAVAALVLNITVWPGLGSIVGGRAIGWLQGFGALLLLAGIFLFAVADAHILGWLLLGPFHLAIWIWGIVTGVHLIQLAAAGRNGQQVAAQA